MTSCHSPRIQSAFVAGLGSAHLPSEMLINPVPVYREEGGMSSSWNVTIPRSLQVLVDRVFEWYDAIRRNRRAMRVVYKHSSSAVWRRLSLVLHGCLRTTQSTPDFLTSLSQMPEYLKPKNMPGMQHVVKHIMCPLQIVFLLRYYSIPS